MFYKKHIEKFIKLVMIVVYNNGCVRNLLRKNHKVEITQSLLTLLELQISSQAMTVPGPRS